MTGKRPFPTPEQIWMAREADLLTFIQNCGYRVKKSGVNEYQMEEHDSLKISKNKWCWHSQNRIGGSCIDFAMHYPVPNQTDFKEAVFQVLDQMYSQDFNLETIQKPSAVHVKLKAAENQPLALPAQYENNHRVIAYLTKTRLIDREIVLAMIQQKRLYESKDKHNCVFLGYDSAGEIRYAFNRGTLSYRRYAGDSTGSNKHFGFAMKGDSEKLYVFESPIDALSHATLTKLKGQNSKADTRLSLGGVSEGALTQYLEDHKTIREIILCLDNDMAGIQSAERIKEIYKTSAYKCAIEIPETKDFNEDLVIFMQKNRQKVMG